MFVFIASVHHTGTQFTEKLFLDAGYAPTDKHGGVTNDDYHRAHIAHSVKAELKDWLDRGFPLVVPLRHPIAVAKSWLARKKPLREMVSQFELLESLVDPYKPLYLPIDSSDRERYFTNLRLKVDLKLNTDWRVWKSKMKGGPHQAQLQPVALTVEDEEIIAPIVSSAFMRRFYPTAGRL